MSFFKKNKHTLKGAAAGSLIGMPFLGSLFGGRRKKRAARKKAALAQHYAIIQQQYAAEQSAKASAPQPSNPAMTPHLKAGDTPTPAMRKSGFYNPQGIFVPGQAY